MLQLAQMVNGGQREFNHNLCRCLDQGLSLYDARLNAGRHICYEGDSGTPPLLRLGSFRLDISMPSVDNKEESIGSEMVNPSRTGA